MDLSGLQNDIKDSCSRLKIEGYLGIFTSEEQIACFPNGIVLVSFSGSLLFTFIIQKELVASSHSDSILTTRKFLGNLRLHYSEIGICGFCMFCLLMQLELISIMCISSWKTFWANKYQWMIDSMWVNRKLSPHSNLFCIMLNVHNVEQNESQMEMSKDQEDLHVEGKYLLRGAKIFNN